MRKILSHITLLTISCGLCFQARHANAQSNDPESEPPADTTELPSPRADDSNADIDQESKIRERIQKKTRTELKKGEISGTGFGFFGGTDLGLVFTAPTDRVFEEIESSQLGVAPVLKFGGSVFTRRIALDLNLGLQYSYYRGTIISLPTINDFGEVEFVPVNTKYSYTQAAMLIEAAGRLRVKPKIQLGLLANATFSTSSAAFSSVPEFEGANAEKYMALIGPQLVYETDMNDTISRISGSFLISLTSSKRTAYIASIGASLGSFLVNPVTVVKTNSQTKFRTKVIRETINLKAQTADFSDNVSFIFDSQMVNFKLNSAELNPKSAGFITELGEMFSRERDMWSKLLIEGHTDSRGRQEYNIKLSKLRARSVLSQLVKAGVARESMEAEGLGPTRLLVSPERNEVDYARNRRVEIRIFGPKDARALRKYVDEIQAKHFGKPAEIRTAPVPERLNPEDSPASQQPVFDPGLE